MMKKMQKRMSGARFLRDRGGNFAMMTAIIFPVLLAAGGVAIDVSNMVMTKSALQDATDSAALAAASAMANDGYTKEQAKLIALQFLRTQMGGSIADDTGKASNDKDLNSGISIDIEEVATVGTGKSFAINISMDKTIEFNAFTRLLGQSEMTMTAKSSAASATESKNAVSMYLVLDKSGSMAWITNEKNKSVSSCINWTEANWGKKVNATSPCYVPKMAALKLAVASLFTQFAVADPTNQFVRTGAIAYDSVSYKPSAMGWGSKNALDYVNKLDADGGTASGAATTTAFNDLMKESENAAHKAKNGQVPTKYILLMTDGDNNNEIDNTTTKKVCDDAKAAKFEIYSVAFMAPKTGQNLLKYCATTQTDHYFAAENMAALINAFKAIGERTSMVVSRLTK